METVKELELAEEIKEILDEAREFGIQQEALRLFSDRIQLNPIVRKSKAIREFPN